MDELVKQGQWWFVLLVPIATGAFALLGSWLGVRLSKLVEHDQWLRNEKYTVYKQVYKDLESATRLIFDAYLDRVAPLGTEINAPGSLAFDLVSSDSVYEERGKCATAIFSYHHAVYKARELEKYDDPHPILRFADNANSCLQKLRQVMRNDLRSEQSRKFRKKKFPGENLARRPHIEQ